MLLLVLAVLTGLVAGWLRPRLGAFTARPRFSWLPLLGVGAALNLGAYLLDGRAATLALVASLVLLVGFTAVNGHLTGVAVIGVGLLCNLVAVVLNDGMPVRGDALVAAGVVEPDELDTIAFAGARHLETASDTLPILGDVLPVPIPFAPEVLSFGDLIVVVGAADAVRDLARRRHRRPARAAQPAAAPISAAAEVVDLDAALPQAQVAPQPAPVPPGRSVDDAALPARAAPAALQTDRSSDDPPRHDRTLDDAPMVSRTLDDAPRRPRRFTGPGEPARPLAASPSR